jgi:hypothetical protein
MSQRQIRQCSEFLGAGLRALKFLPRVFHICVRLNARCF